MTDDHHDTDPLGPLRAYLSEPRHLTLRQVANRSGMPVDELVEIYRALGVDAHELLGESAVAEAAALRQARETLPLAAVVRLARARRMAASQVAANDVVAVRDELLAATDGSAMATAIVDSAAALWPVSTQLFTSAHRRAVERLLRLSVADEAVRAPGQGVGLAVGFVDAVGFTRFSAMVAPAGLARTVEAFEDHVLAATAGHDDVTVPKFIGDAAMVVATDAVVLAGVLLSVVEPVAELEDTPLRAGMGAGEVLARGGDYYGGPVNLAARLTDFARPGTLLADEALRGELEDHFAVCRIPKLRLHGLGTQRPLAVRRPAPVTD